MKTIKLTDKEIRALGEYLSANPCTCACAYTEMQKSTKSCEECDLTKARDSILEKLVKLEK